MTQAQTDNPTMPADLPPDSWIPYEAFSFLLPTMTKFAWEAGGKAGRLPAGKRMTPRSPIAYRAGDIAQFFADCAAEVAGHHVSDEDVQALHRDIQNDRSSAVGTAYTVGDGALIL